MAKFWQTCHTGVTFVDFRTKMNEMSWMARSTGWFGKALLRSDDQHEWETSRTEAKLGYLEIFEPTLERAARVWQLLCDVSPVERIFTTHPTDCNIYRTIALFFICAPHPPFYSTLIDICNVSVDSSGRDSGLGSPGNGLWSSLQLSVVTGGMKWKWESWAVGTSLCLQSRVALTMTAWATAKWSIAKRLIDAWGRTLQ